MDESQYLEQRVDDQINWYDRKSSQNQRAYKRLRLLEIVAAASIPLLAGYSAQAPTIGIAIGIIGLVVAVIAGVVSLFRFQENWTEYRMTAESLKQEKFLFLARAEPYNIDRPFGVFVPRIEGLLRKETTGWAEALRAAAAADTAERDERSADSQSA